MAETRYLMESEFNYHAARFARLLRDFEATLPEGICVSPLYPAVLGHFEDSTGRHFEEAHVTRAGDEWWVEYIELAQS